MLYYSQEVVATMKKKTETKCLFWIGFGQAIIIGAIFTVIALFLRLIVATYFNDPNAVIIYRAS